MTIYEELIERVDNGENFYIDFEKRTMKVGKDYLIKDGEYDKDQMNFPQMTTDEVLNFVENLYDKYKHSLPSERADHKRKKYFKALPIEEIADEALLCAERREVAQAKLEGFILCMILGGQLKWDESIMQGKWFWASKNDSNLVILRRWIEGEKT